MTSNHAIEEYEAFLTHLQDAERALSRALDVMYTPHGITRGLGYRLRVARAQSTVMTLLVRELNTKDVVGTDGGHEWERIEDHIWECIYCERQVTPRRMGRKLVFVPNFTRRIPFYGRRWRCHG